MGKITDVYIEKSLTFAFKEVDTQFNSLRQEIRDLRTDIKDGSAFTLAYEQPPPEPELQRGDFISYKYKNQKIWGVFCCQIGDGVWAYFQRLDGDFQTMPTSISRSRVTFEFRPEK